MTPATRRTNVVLRKPLLHVHRVSPVPADNAAVCATAHRDMADYAVQRQFSAARTAAVVCRFRAELAVGEEIHAPVNLAGPAHVLQDLGPFVQEAPSVQSFGVREFVVFVQGARRLFLGDIFDVLFEHEVV